MLRLQRIVIGDEADHIPAPVEPIIDAATFDALQAALRPRNPKAMPPRVVTGPILLTGIATCGIAEINPRSRITEAKIAAFVGVMRSNVLSSETPFRRAYIRSVIDQVEVDEREIRIFGRKTVLERLVAASGGGSPAGVPSFVRKWRARGDSNLWPLPSEQFNLPFDAFRWVPLRCAMQL